MYIKTYVVGTQMKKSESICYITSNRAIESDLGPYDFSTLDYRPIHVVNIFLKEKI